MRIGRRRRGHPAGAPPGAGRQAEAKAEPRVALALASRQLVSVEVLREAMRCDREQLRSDFAFDRRTRVRAVQALFTAMRADALDGVKRLVWVFLDEPLVWQFLADSGWISCDGAVQHVLNDAERRGLGQVEISTRAWTHRYCLEGMSQTNVKTGKDRLLRRVSPWAPALSMPRWQYSVRSGWSDCDLEMQGLLAEALAEAEAQGEAIVRRTVRGTEYDFDLQALTQANVHTGRVRALRYGPPIAVGSGPRSGQAGGSASLEIAEAAPGR